VKKGIKRTSRFLKQYFVFNRHERKGIYVLLALIVCCLLIPRIWVLMFPPQALHISSEIIPVIEDATIDSNLHSTNTTPTLFSFNPNTADSATFVQLGFTPKLAKSILNYRNKGGVFKQANDLYRIYNIDSQHIAALIPYVVIEQTTTQQQPFEPHTPKETRPQLSVELNTADSITLIGLYGIGPTLASRIIAYRERSGGFFDLQQLKEVYGITDETIQKFQGKAYVEASVVRKISINTITLDELKKHPYLRYKTAQAIMNYRQQHGAFNSTDDLKKIILLPDSIIMKLEPYLDFSK
jgi:competence protein ComEA